MVVNEKKIKMKLKMTNQIDPDAENHSYHLLKKRCDVEQVKFKVLKAQVHKGCM